MTQRPMTENQFEVFRQFGSDESCLRPLDLGGRDGSNHSAVLAQLERRGLVESKQRCAPLAARGSKIYRLTPEGRAELDRRRAAAR